MTRTNSSIVMTCTPFSNWSISICWESFLLLFEIDQSALKRRLSELLLLSANWAICSAISWQEQVNFQSDKDEVRFVLEQHPELDIDSASSLKQQSWVDMSLHSNTLSWFRANQSLLFLLNAACLEENQHIPIV